MLDKVFLNLKKSIFEIIICTMMSVSVALNIAEAFYVPERFYFANRTLKITLLVTVAIFILQMLFFVFATSKKTAIAGVVLLVLTGIIGIANFFSLGVYTLTIIAIVLLTSLIIFLLSRHTIGIVALILVSNAIFVVISILGYDSWSLGFVLFILGCACAFFYRKYKQDKIDFGEEIKAKTSLKFAGMITIICSVSLVLSGVLYFSIIKPLNPPNYETKIITSLKSMNILKKAGISSEIHLYDDNLSAQNLNHEKTLNNNILQKITPQKPVENDLTSSDTPKEVPVQQSVKNHEENTETAVAVTYDIQKDYWKIVLLVIIIIGLFVSIKLLVRKIHFNRLISKGDRKEQVVNLYQDYLHKLSKVGLDKRESDTFYEYAGKINGKFKNIKNSSIDIEFITNTFISAKYGNVSITDSVFNDFKEFYKDFFSNAKYYLGTKKYSIKFFLC